MRALALAAVLLLPAAAANDARLESRIQRGIDEIYRMEFDDCERTFQDLLQETPGLPYAYFGLATVSWARFEYQEEESNLARHAEFEKRIKDAIVKGNEWVKAHPDDAEGMVCVSGMYGMRARLALMLHQWAFAYWYGRSAVSLAERAQGIDPKLYDAYTGLGMWDYYTDTLPNVVKILGRLIAIRGNAKRGIERLERAAEKAEHTSTAAKLALIELMQDRKTPYYNPALGLKMVREVRRQFPMNPLFHFVELIYLFEDKQGPDAVASAQEFLKDIHERRPYYQERYAPRGYVGLASAYGLSKEWDKAEAALTEAVNILEKGKGHNRWGLWALVRRGQLRDVRGNRLGAITDYRRALEHLDYWDLHLVAKEHLKKAATAQDFLGPMPPP